MKILTNAKYAIEITSSMITSNAKFVIRMINVYNAWDKINAYCAVLDINQLMVNACHVISKRGVLNVELISVISAKKVILKMIMEAALNAQTIFLIAISAEINKPA